MPPESAKLTRGSFTKFLHSSSPPVPFCFCSFRLATEEPARTQVVERLADAGGNGRCARPCAVDAAAPRGAQRADGRGASALEVLLWNAPTPYAPRKDG